MPSQVQIVLQKAQDELNQAKILLTENPYLELGNQSEPLHTLLLIIDQTLNKLNISLGHVFTIENNVESANKFFQVIALLDETANFLQSVKNNNYGSPENTRNANVSIDKCLNYLVVLIEHLDLADEDVIDKEQESSPKAKKMSTLKSSKYQHKTRSELLDILATAFSKEELKELCFRLEIDFDDLPGDSSRKSKARELIAYLERINRIDDLKFMMHELRPYLKE